MKRKLDIAVISDVQLGTYGCHARELLLYLESICPDTLILNGDFIDIWQFRRRYFPKEHMAVIQCILRMSASGTKVYYITGNHDDALRRYSDFSSGNVHLRDHLVLRLKEQTYWIFHGDIFDLSVKISPLVAKLGGKGYDYLILLNRFINWVRAGLGMGKMSFTKKIKEQVKKAVKFISDFEETAINLAASNNYDFVVCGHIHQPQIRTVERKGKKVTYLNSGDWIENLTSLEYHQDKWTLYEYSESHYPHARVAETKVHSREITLPEGMFIS